MAAGPIGFDATDPMATKPFGYRSHSLMEKNIGGALAASNVSYNGFTFPPAIKARATVVPEPNKAKNTTKWQTIVLTIEAIITPYDLEANASGNINLDVDMNEIKLRLSQPCQALSFTLQGFGTFNINQGGNSFVAPTGAGIFDVNNGPKPQVIEWEPMGMARCARIEWLVTTSIPPCGVNGSSNGLTGLTDFGYEIEWGIAVSGVWTRTIAGHIELPKTRTPTNNVHASNVISLEQMKAQYDSTLTVLNQMFPPLNSWERAEKFKLSLDRKTLNFSFNDTEILASQPIPRGILKISLKETLSAGWEGKFNTWLWGMHGEITVPFKKGGNMPDNKKLAFFAFGVLLRDRLTRASSTAKTNLVEDGRGGAIISDATTDKEKNVTLLPLKIEVENEIYGAEISVDVRYKIICPPSEIWKVTGFFTNAKNAGLSWEQWREFIGKSGTRLRTKNIIPGQEVIVDLCHPLTGSSTEEKAHHVIEQAPQSLLVPKAPEEAHSWTEYENDFKYETSYYTTGGVLLSENAAEIKDSRENVTNADRERGLSVLPQISSSTPKLKDVHTSTSSDPVTLVTMIGYASRVGYSINAPVLVSIGGAEAIRYGTDVIIPSSEQSGYVNASGKNVRVHKLKWKRQYLIKGTPENWRLTSTGHPEIYL